VIRQLSALLPLHRFVLAEEHKEPTQDEKDHNLDRAGCRVAGKCLEVQSCCLPRLYHTCGTVFVSSPERAAHRADCGPESHAVSQEIRKADHQLTAGL
jgi:hypothetical protein